MLSDEHLSECLIPNSSILEFSTMKTGDIVPLNFLDPLRLQNGDDFFLPQKIFVRQCMKDVLRLFCKDVADQEKQRTAGVKKTVLIGSPGVGKSVLFFLAALFQAKSSNIIYFRCTAGEDQISVFLMMPDRNDCVRVWFTRNLRKESFGAQLALDVYRGAILKFSHDRGKELNPARIYTFVDGPRHSDIPTIIKGTYDYFCTSGGHPLPKQELQARFRMCVLNGWTKVEAIDGLLALHGMQRTRSSEAKERARRAYELCGGSIRNMLRAFESDDQYQVLTDEMNGTHSKPGCSSIEFH